MANKNRLHEVGIVTIIMVALRTPSPLAKYLNYFDQCQANQLRLITSQHHSWNHVPTLSPSSSCAASHSCFSYTTEASKPLAAAIIVGSRLDYCNCLRAGTSISNLTPSSARVVAQKPRFCHITPVLSKLHWLPVRHRISFKIATVTFRVLHAISAAILSCISHPKIRTDASTPLFFSFVNLCSST